MLRKMRGFTIVEVLIIIFVLGILVSIGTVGWNGAITSSRDRTRDSDVKQWLTTFDLYKGRYIVWPAMTNSDATPKVYCLGKPTSGGNPKVFLNKCVQYNTSVEFNGLLGTEASTASSDYTTFTTELAKIGSVPENNGPTIKNVAYAGPFIYLWQTTTGGNSVTVNAHFINFFETACPSGYTRITTSPAFIAPSSIPASFTASYTGLFTSVPSIPSSVFVCYIQKSFTYTNS